MADLTPIINAALDAAIVASGATGPQSIFVGWNGGASTFTRTSNLFVTADISSISTKSSSGFHKTAISPWFSIAAAHTNPYIGESVAFTDMSNNSYTVTLAGVTQIQGTDIAVCLHSSALPSAIVPALLMPSNYNLYLATPFHALITNQYQQIGVVDGVDQYGNFSKSTDSTCAPLWIQTIPGDSSSPVGLVVNNQYVLLGAMWYATQGDDGIQQLLSYNSVLSQTMTNMAASCQQFSTVNLASFSQLPQPGQNIPAATTNTITLTGVGGTTNTAIGIYDTLNNGLTALLSANLSGDLLIQCIYNSAGIDLAGSTISLSSFCNGGAIQSMTITGIGDMLANASFNFVEEGNPPISVPNTGNITITDSNDGAHSMRLTISNLVLGGNITATLEGNSQLVLDSLVSGKGKKIAVTFNGAVGGVQSLFVRNFIYAPTAGVANAVSPFQYTITNGAKAFVYEWCNSINMATSTSLAPASTLTLTSGTLTFERQLTAILGNGATQSSFARSGSGSLVISSASGYNASTDTQSTLFGAHNITGLTANTFWPSWGDGDRSPQDLWLTPQAAINGPMGTISPVAQDGRGFLKPQLANGSPVVYAGALIALVATFPLTVAIASNGTDVEITGGFDNAYAAYNVDTYSIYRNGALLQSGIAPDGDDFHFDTYTDVGQAGKPNMYLVEGLDAGGNVVTAGIWKSTSGEQLYYVF